MLDFLLGIFQRTAKYEFETSGKGNLYFINVQVFEKTLLGRKEIQVLEDSFKNWLFQFFKLQNCTFFRILLLQNVL